LGNNRSMARNLILLVAILVAGMFAASAQANQLQAWAQLDARVAWQSDNPQPGSDHKFNWFALGMTQTVYQKYFETRHGIAGNDVAVYEKYFDEAFMGIAQAIEDAIRSGSTKLSTKEIGGGDVELTSFGTVKVSGISFRQEAKPDAVSAPATVSDNNSVPVEALSFTNVISAITGNRWRSDALIVSGTLTNTSTVEVLITGIDAKGFNQDQKMVVEGSAFTIVHNNLAPGEAVNFKVALKDDAKQVRFVKVLPSWSP
jgi:hypothetical protein